MNDLTPPTPGAPGTPEGQQSQHVESPAAAHGHGNAPAPIIIVRRRKKGHHAHHGGSWKIAYADFVTAMMAFFIMMWLINVVDEDTLQKLSDYFTPTTVSDTEGGSDGMLAGRTLDVDGAKDSNQEQQELEALLQDIEQDLLNQAEQDIKQQLQLDPNLRDLEDNLLIEQTPEGMVIQIVDNKNRPMFNSGSARMQTHMPKILTAVATAIQSLSNKIAIVGHTDATPYPPGAVYTNWELSADRANAVRRQLLQQGIKESRIGRVEGRAALDLFLPEEPRASRNRRISITVLKEQQTTPDAAPLPQNPLRYR